MQGFRVKEKVDGIHMVCLLRLKFEEIRPNEQRTN